SRISEYHTKNNPGIEGNTIYGYVDLLAKGIFGDYKNGADRIKKMQLLQCEWVRLSLELFQRNQWYSSGIIYWMLNDCWPAANGWSLIDYYGRPKPAFYAFAGRAKPVVASIDAKKDGRVTVNVSVNGFYGQLHGSGRLYAYDIVSGEEELLSEFSFDADRDGRSFSVAEGDKATCYGRCDGGFPAVSCVFDEFDRRRVLICDVTSGLGSDRAFSLPPDVSWGEMEWPDEKMEIEEENGKITVFAVSTIPVVLLDTGEILDRNCFFLKKGENATVKKLK
ncbi:MAG: hypothetical protein IKS28_00800, partial [Clostridia bacterium]|nr:hypothetical protein [Clostridia bacterium]